MAVAHAHVDPVGVLQMETTIGTTLRANMVNYYKGYGENATDDVSTAWNYVFVEVSGERSCLTVNQQ